MSNNEGQGPPQGTERPPWASGADFQAPGTQPPPQAAPPWASGAPYVQYPPPGALPVVPMQQYPPGIPYAAQFVPNAPMLYAMPPPVMQMPPQQPMEESSSSEEEEEDDEEEDEHDDFLTGATPPSSPRASAVRHVKIRLKIDGASVQENGNELAPLPCALTGQRSSGAPLGGNRWGAVGQPSAAPIARQNLASMGVEDRNRACVEALERYVVACGGSADLVKNWTVTRGVLESRRWRRRGASMASRPVDGVAAWPRRDIAHTAATETRRRPER